MSLDLKGIKGALTAVPEIAACYLFGSAAKQEAVVNDLDLLILVRPEADAERAFWALTRQISESIGIEADRVDILLFDPQQADAEVLFRAVNEGKLLKNELPDLLTDKIEALSRFLVEHEYLINEAKRLRDELIEEFSAGG
jgi:predicted nucleotidyltransferase